MSVTGKVEFFPDPAAFRRWLERHHDKSAELWVGFHKRATGKPSLTWRQSVEQALCFGWIDGLRKSIDGDRYKIRFTPRKRGSRWSKVNLGLIDELTRRGLMRPAGKKAFDARTQRAGYSYEDRNHAVLPPEDEKRLRTNRKAAAFFDAQAPWYRKTTIHWIISAKKEETRRKRLQSLIDWSAKGLRIPPLRR
jgi:uncharacterized protein YdeI (YjbR/CyaY-like superfamily)